MGKFSKTREETGAMSVRSDSISPGISVIAPGMRVVGRIETEGPVRIEGRVDGDVHGKGQVMVANGAVVEGDIYTAEAILGGEVRGGIAAQKRAEVQSTSTINGDIVTPRIAIQEGGQLNGSLRIETPNGKPGRASQSDNSRGRKETPEPNTRQQSGDTRSGDGKRKVG
jgi:cytoskeletal protein CcmA (bactofilin family)